MRMTSTLNNVGATLLSFCLLVLIPDVNLKGICDNASPKVQTTCNDLITYLTGHADDQLNSVSGETTDLQTFNDESISRDSVDKLITEYFKEKARQQLKPDAILSRRRRGNGYIRFGRSAQSSLPSNLFNSFGTSAQGGSHGGRYARSVPSDEPSSVDAANPMQKRFMRFGKKSGKPSAEAEKRFMRFGKKSESLQGKRFMRFGKKDGNQDFAVVDVSSLNDNNVDQQAEKRFMRFGKKDLSENDSPDQPQKRFMRFGKREDENENENSQLQGLADNDLGVAEKRFMRFGKRFDDGLSPEKRFMRFGKRAESDIVDPEKRFMRFGKRFMRFGRSGMENTIDADKRFMRFGKKWLPQKRFMRFGKRDQELVDGAFT